VDADPFRAEIVEHMANDFDDRFRDVPLALPETIDDIAHDELGRILPEQPDIDLADEVS
jgi:hypothetical protein